MQNTAQEDGTKIPILGSIPIIGNLFKSKADRKEQTELMVLITPQLVRPLDPDEVPSLPTSQNRFMPAPGVGSAGEGKGMADAPAEQPAKKLPPPPPVIKKDSTQ
jgi:pilus assembly protein CpaC